MKTQPQSSPEGFLNLWGRSTAVRLGLLIEFSSLYFPAPHRSIIISNSKHYFNIKM